MVAAQPYQAHDEPNTVFRDTSYDVDWIEVYHSRPSWRVCQISYRKDRGDWVPFGKFQLIDASEHRPGFRVFRIKASHLEFRLSDATGSTVDSIHGQNYTIESPGRYVVESGSGCRRLSDAQISDCLRALRPHDRFIEVIFEADPSWFKCYIAYALQGDSDQTWRKVKMSLRCQEPAFWFTRIDARKGLKCAFNNGEGAWDSNCDLNYQMSLPGKYIVGLGSLIYYGPSDLDLHTT